MKKAIWAAGILALGVAVGGGAMLSSNVSAAEAVQGFAGQQPEGMKRGVHSLLGGTELATLLGMTQDKLKTALKSGIPAKTEKLVNKEFDGKGRGKHGKGGMGLLHLANQEELLTLLGVTSEELMTAMKSGQSLADVATGKGVAVESVIDVVAKHMIEHLDQGLASGKLTQAQYDAKKATVADKATKLVNGDFKGMGKHGRGGHHHKGHHGSGSDGV